MTPEQFAFRTMHNEWEDSEQMGRFVETCFPEIRAYQSSSDPKHAAIFRCSAGEGGSGISIP